MADQKALYLGLMSGTSVDSIDAAIVDFGTRPPRLVATENLHFPAHIREQIFSLCERGDDEIERLGVLDRELGYIFSTAANTVIKNAQLSAADIVAIGSHGQTIRHRPTTTVPFTMQVGDPSTIAQETGVTTVADFRRRDISAGGQGAPLAPAFHNDVFSSASKTRFIINVGGMANITRLSHNKAVVGFDTGPGNVLMDGWIQHKKNKPFDRDGAWAASGRVNPALLDILLQHPFFSAPPPKSTGREDFNLRWVFDILESQPDLSPEDIQATLLELTASTIRQAIDGLDEEGSLEIYICGGGAHNQQLMSRLEQLLPEIPVATTAALGIDADWVEAAAFAWLAKQTLAKLSGNAPSVTGAHTRSILGGVYFSA